MLTESEAKRLLNMCKSLYLEGAGPNSIVTSVAGDLFDFVEENAPEDMRKTMRFTRVNGACRSSICNIFLEKNND